MIEPLGPFSVSDSGSPKSNQLNAVEDVGLGNIDVAEAGEGAAERNPSNDEPLSMRGFSEFVQSVVPNGIPHAIHGLLNFASLASVLVLSLS